MKKTIYKKAGESFEHDTDLQNLIAALLVMDGETWDSINKVAEEMYDRYWSNPDHEPNTDTTDPQAYTDYSNYVALFEAKFIVDQYRYAEAGSQSFCDVSTKEELDTIINGIKTKEQDEDEVKTTDEEEGTTMKKVVYRGIMMNELQKLNDKLAEDYGNRYVTIYADPIDLEGNGIHAEVSWASIGDVTPEEATRFAGQLLTAISMAKGFVFNGWEVTVYKEEDQGEAYLKAQTILDEIVDEWEERSDEDEGEAWADLTEKIQEDMKDWKPEEDPYWMLKYCDYDELSEEDQAMIDDYDQRYGIDQFEDEDEDAEEWTPAPAWADYDTIDKIAMMMMNDGEPAWRLRDRAGELQAWYDGAVEAAVMLGATPPARVMTLMRNCHTLREAAAIIDMHAPVVPTVPCDDDDELPY